MEFTYLSTKNADVKNTVPSLLGGKKEFEKAIIQ